MLYICFLFFALDCIMNMVGGSHNTDINIETEEKKTRLCHFLSSVQCLSDDAVSLTAELQDQGFSDFINHYDLFLATVS